MATWVVVRPSPLMVTVSSRRGKAPNDGYDSDVTASRLHVISFDNGRTDGRVSQELRLVAVLVVQLCQCALGAYISED